MIFKGWLFRFDQKSLDEVSIDEKISSIDQFVISLPIGVYTTFRTIQNVKIFQLKYHLDRLVESINLAGHSFPYSINDIRQPLFFAIGRFPVPELRIRLFIPFDEGSHCYIMLEELIVPNIDAYTRGVKVNTNHLSRDNPKAKLTSFIKESEKIKLFCKESGLEESLILNSKNEILEGLSSNFFTVMDEIIYTADKEVLSGVTRRIILDEAKIAGIPVLFEPISFSQIEKVDEAFISSTSRGVLPVNSIDNILIGDGKPGKITKFLSNKLNDRMNIEAETII